MTYEKYEVLVVKPARKRSLERTGSKLAPCNETYDDMCII
jgi:hypothetical protein